MPHTSSLCAVLGCGRPRPCAVHQPARARLEAWESARGPRAARGYGARWDRFRRAWLLAMAKRRLEVVRFGLCGARLPEAPDSADSVCAREGRHVSGFIADHIRPVTGPDDPTFFRFASLQLLCRSCDQAKRQREATSVRVGAAIAARVARVVSVGG